MDDLPKHSGDTGETPRDTRYLDLLPPALKTARLWVKRLAIVWAGGVIVIVGFMLTPVGLSLLAPWVVALSLTVPALLFGAGATIDLIARVSQVKLILWRRQVRNRSGDMPDAPPLTPLQVTGLGSDEGAWKTATAVCATMLVLLVIQPFVPFGGILLGVLMLLPLAVLLWATKLVTNPRRVVKSIVLVVAFFGIAVTAIYTIELHNILGTPWVASIFQFVPGYNVVVIPFIGTASLALIGTFVAALGVFWRQTALDDELAEASQPAKGPDSTTLQPESNADDEPSDPVLDHVWSVLAASGLRPPDGQDVFVKIAASAGTNTAPPGKDDRYRPFFADSLPTIDQQHAFDRFSAQYRELATRKLVDGRPEHRTDAMLLVHGPVGSGRSCLLRCCALESALGAGRNALFIVADSQDVPVAIAALHRLLVRVQLADYVSLGGLPSKPTVGSNPTAEAWPMIAVADLQTAEDLLYGIPLASQALPIALRYPTILVDDLLQMDTGPRAHLPHFIHKHRLLLNAHHIPMHVVLASESLSLPGRRYLPEVFAQSTSFSLGGDVFELRFRRNLPHAVRIDTVADSPRIALADLLRTLCESAHDDLQPSDILVFGDGMTDDERNQIEAAANGVHIARRDTALPDLRAKVIVVRAFINRDLTASLLATVAAEDAIIITVFPDGALAESPPLQTTPIFPAPHAESLVEAHYRGLAAQLGGQRPGLRYEWQRFGLHWRSTLPGVQPQPVSQSATLIDACESLDCGTKTEIAALLADKPAITPPTVDVSQLTQPSRGDLQLAGCQIDAIDGLSDALSYTVADVIVRREDTARARRPSASWNIDGRSIDLARSRSWHFVHQGQRYGLDPGASANVEEWRFMSRVLYGGEDDYIVPGGDWAWECAEDWPVSLPQGDAKTGMRFAKVMGPPAEIAVRITDLMNDSGGRRDLGSHGVRFDYDATLSALVFGGGSRRLATDGQLLCRDVGLAGPWRNAQDASQQSRRYLPALTAAFEYALATHLKGFPDFGRVFAFELRDSRRLGDIWVWIVEPTGTEYTLISALSTLFSLDSEGGNRQSSDQLERAIFRSLRWFLNSMSKLQGDRRLAFARQLSQCTLVEVEQTENGANCIDSPLTDSELKQGLALAQRVLDALDQESGQAPTERLDPKAHFGPVVAPIIDPDSRPIWSTDAEVVTWRDCVERLWNQASDQFTPQSTIAFIIEGNLPDIELSAKSANLDDERVAIHARSRGSIAFTSSPGLAPEEFPEAVVRALPVQIDGLPEGSPITLRLWIVDAGQLPDRNPSPDDRFHAAIVGGLADGGLILTFVVDDESQPTPVPTPFPAPAFTLPDDIPEADTGAITFTPVTLATPRVHDNPTAGTRTYTWTVDGKTYTCHWGFSTKAERDTYLDLLDTLPGRISCAYFGYLANDPFLGSIHEFADHLKVLYGPGRPNNADFARYLVRFVQSFPYIRDPKRGTDWPRFPSEFLANNGGDCEDSSLMLAALLAHFGYRFCLLSLPGHMAVGLAGPHTGAYFNGDDGHRYYFVETATNGSELPIGDTSNTSPAELLHYLPLSLPPPCLCQILTADINCTTSTLTVHLYTPVSLQGSTLAIHTGPRGNEFRIDLPRDLVGSLKLTSLKQPGIATITILIQGTPAYGTLASDIVIKLRENTLARWSHAIEFRKLNS